MPAPVLGLSFALSPLTHTETPSVSPVGKLRLGEVKERPGPLLYPAGPGSAETTSLGSRVRSVVGRPQETLPQPRTEALHTQRACWVFHVLPL